MNFLRVMGACFVVAGVACCVSPVLLVMGICWIVVGIVLLGVGQSMAAREARRQRLLKTGKAGRATVLEVKDTAVTINRNPRVRVRIRIEVPDGTPVEATSTMLVSRVAPPRVGEVYDVRFEPEKPDDFVFVSPSSGTVSTPAQPAHPARTSIDDDTLDRLLALSTLRDKGDLTPEEFETQKRKLLGED